MGFRIHAAGSNGFRYTRDDQPDGDIFQAAAIMTALQGLQPSVSSGVQTTIDYYQPNAGEADAARVVAGITFLQLLSDAVDMLGTCAGAGEGWISVSPRQSHTLWPDTSAFARYEFFPGDSPGAEFIQRITPILVSTNMNNYGVLRAMSNALSLYWGHIDISDRPMIQIQLSK